MTDYETANKHTSPEGRWPLLGTVALALPVSLAMYWGLWKLALAILSLIWPMGA